MSSETIKSATAADEAAVLGVITMAFSTDPVARWIYPNPREYLAHFPSFVLAIGAKAFASGSAHYAEGFAGATLWLPPGVSPDEERPVAMIRETVAERLQGDLFRSWNRWARHIQRSPTGICGHRHRPNPSEPRLRVGAFAACFGIM